MNIIGRGRPESTWRILMRKSLIALLGLLLAIGFLAGCGGKEETVIKVAIAAPQTGDFAEYGNGFRNAVQLKVKEVNEAGGVLGQQVEVLVFDDKNNGEEAATIAEKIVADESVLGVVGHFASGICMAASPIYQEVGLVEISPSASHPDYTSEGNYIFRNNTVISVEAGEAIMIAKEVLGAKTIAVLSVATDWGVATAGIAKDIIEMTSGIEVAGMEEIMDGTVDYSPTITALEADSPDVILVAGMYNVLAPFATQYKAVNPDMQFVGFSNAYSQQLIELAGDSAEDIYMPAIFFSGSPDADVRSFVSAYEVAYGSAPSALTAQAYDSMGIILQAIETAGEADRAMVRDAVAAIEYDGVTGDTTFDQIGDADKSFNWLKVENGDFIKVAK